MVTKPEKGKSYSWHGIRVAITDVAGGYYEEMEGFPGVARSACMVCTEAGDDAGKVESAPLDELHEILN
jgi:hypothetical protein